jgi:TonB family protein
MKISVFWVRLLLILALINPLSVVRAQGDGTIPDKDIKVVSFENMRYPAIAQTANVKGVVVVRVSLDRGGKVTDAQALSGAPLLVIDTVQNAKKWRFQPNAQKAAILVYEFQIIGLCAHDQDSSQLILQPPNLALITACSFTVQTNGQSQ